MILPDASLDVSSEEDKLVAGTSGEELVSGSEHPTESDLAEA